MSYLQSSLLDNRWKVRGMKSGLPMLLLALALRPFSLPAARLPRR